MKLVSGSGKHVKKSSGAKLAEAVQQRMKESVNTAVDNQVAKMQAKSAARAAEQAKTQQKTRAPEKQATSHKAPSYQRPAEPKKGYTPGRHEAPPKKPAEPKKTYTEPRHEAPARKPVETKTSYTRPKYEAPAKKPEPKKTAAPKSEFKWERYEEPARKPEPKKTAEPKPEFKWERYEEPVKKTEPKKQPEREIKYTGEKYERPVKEPEYKPEPEKAYSDPKTAPRTEEKRAEPEFERTEYRTPEEPSGQAVDSADKFADMFNEEFFYDEWMPVGTKAKIRKKQELQVRQKEELERKQRKKDLEYEDFDEWDIGRRKKKSKDSRKKKKKRGPARAIITIICILVIFVDMYFRFLYTDVPFIRELRDAYIETAMSTMSHQWMAEWFFPQEIIDEVVGRVEKAQQAQQGLESDWHKKPEPEPEKDENAVETEADFYELFWELDKNTFKDYVADHPEVLDNGWGEIKINEAGLNDNGTSIWTKMDEQVLAIDVPNKIILIRVQGSGYQGVLAVAKDSSRLSLCAAQNVGSVGEQLDSIMQRTDGILGMTGSGFIDEGGNGNGGSIVGFARCDGQDFGTQVGYPYKRTELREDNLLYVVDSGNEVSKKATDAVEFAPALVINGEALIDELSGYTSINPRACIGQTEKGELLMLVIEGRLPSRSFGTGLPECTEILMQHNAYQAMNLDGGTSAIMWYDGEYVTKCSNTAITCRTLPNAWVYAKESLD